MSESQRARETKKEAQKERPLPDRWCDDALGRPTKPASSLDNHLLHSHPQNQNYPFNIFNYKYILIQFHNLSLYQYIYIYIYMYIFE